MLAVALIALAFTSSHAAQVSPVVPAEVEPLRAVAALDATFDFQRVAFLCRANAASMPSAAAIANTLGRADFVVRPALHGAGAGWMELEFESPLGNADALRLAGDHLAGLLDSGFVAPVLRGAHGTRAVPTDRILVRWVASKRAQATRLNAELLPGARVLRTDFAGLEGVYELELSTGDGFQVLDIARSLRAREEVEWVEPVVLAGGQGSQAPPNDPLYPVQWGHVNTGQNFLSGPGQVGFDMGLAQAHALTTGSAAAGVLILDTGVQANHPDLVFTSGTDFMSPLPIGVPGSPQNAFDNHGTAVAGVIAARRNNGIGIAGVAPSAALFSARIFESVSANGSWTTLTGNTALALDWGVSVGARVTVNSNAYGFTEAVLEAKYAQTRAGGMVHFVSAGNFTSFGVTYPATLPTTFAIGGTAPSGATYNLTSIGPEVDFAGPGFEVWTLDRSGAAGYGSGNEVLVQGTSFAGPFVAGAAALCVALDPTLDADDVGEILRASCTDVVSGGIAAFVGKDVVSGYGQPDAGIAAAIAAGLASRLSADGGPISVWQGGVQNLILDAGVQSAGSLYMMLGSLSGTAPGLNLPGFPFVPLNFDPYFELRLASPGLPPLTGALGFLDANGRATAAAFTGALPPNFAGLELHHAAVVIDPFPIPLFGAPSTIAQGLRFDRRARAAFNGPAVAIPDASSAGIDFPISLTGVGGPIAEVSLITNIDAGFYGHVRLRLTSPAGTVVLVHGPNLSEASVNMKAVFGGYFATTQSMAAFQGESANGTWILNVADVFFGQNTTVNGFELVVRTL